MGFRANSNRQTRANAVLNPALRPRTLSGRTRPSRCPAPRIFNSADMSAVPQGADMQEEIKVLRAELSVAVSREDYSEAARLRDEIRDLEDKDPVLDLKRRFEEAIEGEKYEEAASIRDKLKELGQLDKPKDETPPLAQDVTLEIPCSSDEITNDVRVRVRSFFVPHLSNISRGQYVFAYQVEISNESDNIVQLKNRHWVITDGTGHVEEVRGPGVIGQQPVLSPGRYFQYMSVCPLQTTRGSMEGEYEMDILNSKGEWQETMDVKIGKFGLDISVEGNTS